MNNIAVVHSDKGDWVGLYVDGTLVTQGASLPPEQVVSSVVNAGQLTNVLVTSNTNWNRTANGGVLPHQYSDVILDTPPTPNGS